MDAVVFSWSGSFRDAFEEPPEPGGNGEREDVDEFVDAMHERGMDVGIVTGGERESVEDLFPTDFVVPQVEDLREVLAGLRSRYDKVFFVTDVKEEIATANQSGAFTVGFSSGQHDADELSGMGPNYLVDSLEELEKILELEGIG